MGQSKQRKEQFFKNHPRCIFCGGGRAASTEEHCPPRALFKDKHWPEGQVFAACASCNGGTSDDDLMVAYLAHTDPSNKDPAHFQRGSGLMKGVNRQFPGALKQMFERSNVQARSDARRLNLKPSSGQLYRDLGIVSVPEAMPKSVGTLAAKLTKAIYYQQMNEIFPSSGGIMFQWFTNAQLYEYGKIPVLEVMSAFAGMSPPIQRSRIDLKDQFDYQYSMSDERDIHVVRAVFGRVFGFVTIFSQTLGRLEMIEDSIKEKLGCENGPFQWLSTNRLQY